MDWRGCRWRIAKVVQGGNEVNSEDRPHQYRVAQANLQKSKLATAELIVEAGKRKLAFAMVQEPYIGGIGEMKNYPGTRVVQCARKTEKVNKAAIVLFDDTINVTQCPTLTTENFAVAKLRTAAWEIGVVSVYLDGGQPIEPDLGHLRKIMEGIGVRDVILGGDVNAWNTWWGSREADHRGEALAGALDELGLQILNMGTAPTFDVVRGGQRYCSCVDITTCTEDMLRCVVNWRLSGDVTTSDHKAILFELKLEKSKGMDIIRTTRKYNTKKAKWGQFYGKLNEIWEQQNINKTEIDKLNTIEELDKITERYTESIEKACEGTIPIVSKRNQTGLPWWTEELTRMKEEVKRRKRRISGAAPRRRAWVLGLYLAAKEELKQKMESTLTSSWKEFCGRQERETMWDSIYRVISRTANRQEDIPLVQGDRVLSSEESARMLAKTFYPEDKTQDDDADHSRIRELANRVNENMNGETFDPLFTVEELKWSVSSFNPKKAPGIDGLTADICRAAITHNPQLFLAVLNRCLSLFHFPTIWKEAVVVVLRKPGKDDYAHPKSYRPIGLLPVLGKILEKMLIRRIRWHISPQVSRSQYGFMPQRSTEDSLYDLIKHIRDRLKEKKIVVVISLDIEGAFDNAWWPAMKCRLAETPCPINLRRLVDSYLLDRRVRVRYAGAEFVQGTSKGCVQGSIGGPTFWNLLLDPLLKELEQRGDYCQAFADDVVLIFSGETALDVQRQANASLAHVQRWGVGNKLKFAPHKTKAMVVTNKLKYDSPLLRMGGEDIALSREIKILGLTVDDKLTFNAHASNVTRKALNIYKQLSRAAKISWGLKPEIIRTIYTAVVEPVIMYAASAWAPATNKKGMQKQLETVQRGFVQKIIKAYRTTSLNSALLLSGLLPLDLRIREAASFYEEKRGYSRRVTGDRDIETPVPYTELPHPASQVGLQFECVVNDAEMDQQELTIPKIFTDGSKIQGKVGAALSLWENGVEVKAQKFKLDHFCTVYQAELLALHRASELALKHPSAVVQIYCDSRSALETVTRGDSLHPLAFKTQRNIQALNLCGKTIQLFWIKAHAGLEGNERADVLAKEAAIGSKTRPHYDLCPASFAKRKIRMESLGEWSARYESGETAATTKMFLPDAIAAYQIVRKIVLSPVIVQVLTGHGGFSEYLNRFKCKESPACPCDPSKNESVLHVLTECPIFARNKHDLESEICRY